MKKEVYGSIELSGEFILPLEEAHKIQAILARHAEQVSTAWRSDTFGGSIYFLIDSSPPAVTVKDMPYISAKGLSYRQLSSWRETVSNSQGGNFLSPQDFINLSEEPK